MHRMATSTNLISFNRDGSRTRMIDLIPRLAGLGYREIDLNFCEMMNPHHDIDEAYINKLKQFKAEYDLSYVQSHVPYPRKDEDRTEDIKTAIRYSTALGVKAIVIHPIEGDNVSYLSQFLPLLEGTDSRLAVENMESGEGITSSSDLMKIINTINSDRLGPGHGPCPSCRSGCGRRSRSLWQISDRHPHCRQ